MKKLLTIGLAVAGLIATASTASAHGTWHNCSGSHAGGSAPVAYHLQARGKMNCPSARYAFSGAYRSMARHWSAPTSFNDGYVTWIRTSVRRIDGYTWTVTYREFKSGTAFRFTYDFIGD